MIKIIYWIAQGKDNTYRVFLDASAVYKHDKWDNVMKFLKAQRSVEVHTANIYDDAKLKELEQIVESIKRKNDMGK